jgi:exopolysaccharide biosynthesis polyprenyl glycosylphosphotransferase
MTNARRRFLLNALKLFDLALMVLAFLLAALFVLHQSRNVTPSEFFSIRVKIQNLAIFALFIALWHVIFLSAGLYTSRRFSNRARETLDVITATTIGVCVILLGAIIFHIRMVTPAFLVVFWLAIIVMTASSRLILRAVLSVVRKRGRNLRDVVIVGTNGRALNFAGRLLSHPEIGYRITGFVDQEWPGIERFLKSGYPLISNIGNFPQFLRHNVVDEVVIALPFRSMHECASLIATCCEDQGVTVRVLNNIFDMKTARSTAEEPEGEALFAHTAGWGDGWPILAKRILDFCLSTIALILLSPVLLLTALLIKITSPGSVLFIQKRVGLHKRPIDVYKFRTMEVNAESRIRELEHLNEVSGPVFKIKKDPRITPFGRLLRKTSIDELPQLLNVLKGEMSLVGPRPLPLRDYEGFSEDWQRRRFSVKPGITCLWQVRGRSSIPFHEWMQLDLLYIEQWSLWLDVRILLQTIPAVFKGLGAA